MQRSAFSMIELVFVIVILGIMAAVAVPKFSSIQDDALISNEKTTISVVRQGLTALYGKRLVRGEDFNITLTDETGVEYSAYVNFSDAYYPISLDVEAVSNGTDNNFTGTTKRGEKRALALVVEPDSLADWNRSGQSTTTSNIAYSGPASNVVTDGNAEIHTGDYWEYNNTSGKILLQ
jgi:prepilin-type N-terminal cleavage/methylation domain-containing protein